MYFLQNLIVNKEVDTLPEPSILNSRIIKAPAGGTGFGAGKYMFVAYSLNGNNPPSYAKIFYSTDGINWTSEDIPSINGYFNFTNICCDSQGNIYILYSAGTSPTDILYLKIKTTTWQSDEIVDNSGNGGYVGQGSAAEDTSAMFVDSSDNLYLYISYGGVFGAGWSLQFAARTGIGSYTKTVLASGATLNDPYYTYSDFAPNGDIWVVYERDSGTNTGIYQYLHAGTWSSPVSLNLPLQGSYVANIVNAFIDTSNVMHVLYLDSNIEPLNPIKYVYGTPGLWSPPLLVVPGGTLCIGLDMSIDQEGTIHIVYSINETTNGTDLQSNQYWITNKNGTIASPILLASYDDPTGNNVYFILGLLNGRYPSSMTADVNFLGLLYGDTTPDNFATEFNSFYFIEESLLPIYPNASPVNGLISFYNQFGNEEFFISQAGSDIWSNGPEGVWKPITGLVKITNAKNNLASMTVLNNILYGVNRIEDQFWEWGLTGNAIPVPYGALYSVSVNNGGSGYQLGDILTVQGGTGGQVQVTQVTTGTNGAIDTTSLENNGMGYEVGDLLTINGGQNGVIQVTSINTSGGIVTYNLINPGVNYSVVTGAVLVGGHGNGATINILVVFISGTIEAVLLYDPNNRSTSGAFYQPSTNAPVSGGHGSGASLVINATTPQINGNFVVNFNNSIFVNAGSSLPTALYYSDLNLGYAINPVNFLLFNTGQGSALTGAVNALFGNMFVFKNKSIHVVSPTGSIPSYSNFLYCDGIGCISHQSIVTLPGGTIMFWDTDDIYMIVGNEVLSATNHPKTKNPRLRNLFRNNVNQNRLKFVCGAYYAPLDCVFWFYSSPGSNSNDMCLAYHVKTKSFWPLTLRGACCAIRLIQNTSFLYTGDIDGYIYQQDNGGSFNNYPINWNVQIPWQALGDLLSRKKGDLVYTILEQQSNFNVLCDVFLNQSNVAYSADNILQTLGITTTGAQFSNGSDSNVFDSAVFASSSTGIMESSFLIDTLFKTISLNFHGSNLNQPLTIHRIALTSRELEMSRLTD